MGLLPRPALPCLISAACPLQQGAKAKVMAPKVLHNLAGPLKGLIRCDQTLV